MSTFNYSNSQLVFKSALAPEPQTISKPPRQQIELINSGCIAIKNVRRGRAAGGEGGRREAMTPAHRGKSKIHISETARIPTQFYKMIRNCCYKKKPATTWLPVLIVSNKLTREINLLRALFFLRPHSTGIQRGVSRIDAFTIQTTQGCIQSVREAQTHRNVDLVQDAEEGTRKTGVWHTH